jgi:dihydroorotate dehydrogenase
VYRFARELFFRLDPEAAHTLALTGLKASHRLGSARLLRQAVPKVPRRVMGIDFPNPVGLAAGLDKNGDYLNALASLGFGFIELGTVTPRPQPGNPQPRLFRLPRAEALINRMGFNNKGVDYLVEQVKRAKYRGVLGINIGKNFDTAVESATDDYLIGLRNVYSLASYVVVNISSPNTPGLRKLQQGELLDELLAALKTEQKALSLQYERYVPLVIKIAPDLEDAEVEAFAAKLLEYRMDGAAATNTTISRAGVEGQANAVQGGGLSGRPLLPRANEVLRQLSAHLKGRIPIIGIGGIVDASAGVQKFHNGASLIQLYSGLIYRGPSLISDICWALKDEETRGLAASGSR